MFFIGGEVRAFLLSQTLQVEDFGDFLHLAWIFASAMPWFARKARLSNTVMVSYTTGNWNTGRYCVFRGAVINHLAVEQHLAFEGRANRR